MSVTVTSVSTESSSSTHSPLNADTSDGSSTDTTMPSTPFSMVFRYSSASSLVEASANTLVPEDLNLAIMFSSGMTVQSPAFTITVSFLPARDSALSWSSGVSMVQYATLSSTG